MPFTAELGFGLTSPKIANKSPFNPAVEGESVQTCTVLLVTLLWRRQNRFTFPSKKQPPRTNNKTRVIKSLPVCNRDIKAERNGDSRLSFSQEILQHLLHHINDNMKQKKLSVASLEIQYSGIQYQNVQKNTFVNISPNVSNSVHTQRNPPVYSG